MRYTAWTLLVASLTAMVIVGCGDDNPASGGDDQNAPLAGGGRYEATDPYDNSGPDAPRWEFPDIDSASFYPILLYSDRNCGQVGTFVIEDSTAFAAWWAGMDSCLFSGWDTLIVPPPDSVWPDSGFSHPGGEPSPWDQPEINFDSFAVVVAAIEEDSGIGRFVEITAIEASPAGTTIRYRVSELDSLCAMLMFAIWIDGASAPTVAVLAPKPLPQPISWVRTDTVYTCDWGFDPNEPYALYYTDTPCDLGPGEEVIRDSASYMEWLMTAWGCDTSRWQTPDSIAWDSTIVHPDSGFVQPGGVAFPGWWMPEIDFSTHAVIVLRAGEQSRWGGGVWLDRFEHEAGAARIDYTVMVPSENCPAVEGSAATVNPTVAILVPLPVDEPIVWQRAETQIDCNWGTDTVRIWPED